MAAARIEAIEIDIDAIIDAFRALQRRVEVIVVEGVGGWLVPIRADYFVSDLAAELKLPVLVVVRNRLGCLNHTALTVRSVLGHDLACAGVVLNDLADADDDIAAATNRDVLGEILDVPILPRLTQKTAGSAQVARCKGVCLAGKHECKQSLHSGGLTPPFSLVKRAGTGIAKVARKSTLLSCSYKKPCT